MYGVLGVERSTDQQRLVVVFKDCFRIIDLKTSAVTLTDPGTVIANRDRQSSASVIYGVVVRPDSLGERHYQIEAALVPFQTVTLHNGLRVDQFFAGKKISFGRSQDGTLVIWNSITNEINATNRNFPKYAEFKGNPDEGTYSFMVEPYEHRPPNSLLFTGTNLISYDSHFIFDIDGDQVLRGFAEPRGVDVDPEELYAVRLPNKHKLWSHTKTDPHTYEAHWINDDVIAKSSEGWQLLSGTTGKVQAKLPFLKEAQYVATVSGKIFAYFPTTAQLVAFTK
jgi:hypothetical protein